MASNLTIVVDGKVARDAAFATHKDGSLVEPKFAKFSVPYSPYSGKNDDGSYKPSDTIWCEVSVGGAQAETAVKFYKKGTHVSIVGTISSASPSMKDGNLRRDEKTNNPIVNLNVRALRVDFVGSRADANGGTSSNGNSTGEAREAVGAGVGAGEEDEGAPF